MLRTFGASPLLPQAPRLTALARRDAGQALVVVVALLGFAALVVLSLSGAEDRIVATLRAQHAAEAAAEAGGAVVADRLVQLAASEEGDHPARADVIAAALREPELPSLAAVAASEVLVRLGASYEQLTLERRVDEISVKVRVRRDGVAATARVGVRAP